MLNNQACHTSLASISYNRVIIPDTAIVGISVTISCIQRLYSAILQSKRRQLFHDTACKLLAFFVKIMSIATGIGIPHFSTIGRSSCSRIDMNTDENIRASAFCTAYTLGQANIYISCAGHIYAHVVALKCSFTILRNFERHILLVYRRRSRHRRVVRPAIRATMTRIKCNNKCFTTFCLLYRW